MRPHPGQRPYPPLMPALHQRKGSWPMTAAKLHIKAGLPPISVYSPFDGAPIGSIDTTDASDVDELIARARRGAELSRNLPRHKRASILEGAAQLIERRRDAFA